MEVSMTKKIIILLFSILIFSCSVENKSEITFAQESKNSRNNSNLIANGNFEDGLQNWEVWGNSGASFTESQGIEGNRLTNYSSSSYEVSTYQTISNIDNGTYILSVFTVGEPLEHGYLFANTHNGEEVQVEIQSSPWGDWNRIILENIEVTQNELTIGVYSKGSSWVSFDNFTLEQQIDKTAVEILSQNGYNYARIRLLVDPPNSYGLHQDLDYVKELARAAHNNGMKILLDIFYSHWWTDPAHNWKPESWPTNIQDLESKTYYYTLEVLNELKSVGLIPDMVQVGNEINEGILWISDNSKISMAGWENTVRLTNAGYYAVKDFSLDIPVIIHYAGIGTGASNWYRDYISNGGKLDIIGLSFYEMWHGDINSLVSTINSLYNTHKKDIIIVETAAYYRSSENESHTNYPHTQIGQSTYLRDLTNSVKNLNGVKGIFYWGTTWSQSWNWLNAPYWEDDDAGARSLFDNNGYKTIGISAIPLANNGALPIIGVDISEALHAQRNGVNYK
jgi:arabinogalactan endo-1,4-beta-galactosidase